MRTIERPWTRTSKSVPRKSYVVGVPFPKTHQFEMGTKSVEFDTVLYGLARNAVQIRDPALEAARIVAHKFLETKLGATNYFMKILVYPHQVIREKPIATGAGADRYSQGMARAFGKPVTSAIQTKEGKKLIELRVSKHNLETAKLALKKFGLKRALPWALGSQKRGRSLRGPFRGRPWDREAQRLRIIPKLKPRTRCLWMRKPTMMRGMVTAMERAD
jgi:large subunit ribosomal protein L10e